MAKKSLSGSDFKAPILLNGSAGTSGQVLVSQGSSAAPIWSDAASGGGSGTVTSIAISTPVGLTVSGSPVTTSGTISISLASGYSIPTSASQITWDTAYGWGNHASAGYLTSASAMATYQPIGSYLTQTSADALYSSVSHTHAYSSITGTPTLATVATSGAYSDLTGKPTLGTMAAAATTDYAALVGATFTGAVAFDGGMSSAYQKNNSIASPYYATGTQTTNGGFASGVSSNTGGSRVIMTASASGSVAPPVRPNGDALQAGDIWIGW